MVEQSKRGRWVVEVVLVDHHLLQDILNGSIEEASFDTEAEARRECDRLERKIRQELGPFCGWQGDLSMLTPLDPAVFCDWLLDAGIDPPPAARDGSRDWEGWYDRVEGDWDDSARAHFWQGLEQPRFYRVSKRPSRKAHAVLELGRRNGNSEQGWVGWTNGHQPPDWTGDEECRRTVAVFRSRAAAERHRREREEQARQSPRRPQPEEGPLFELAEVDWVGPPTSGPVALVQRRAVCVENEFEQFVIWRSEQPDFIPYVPLRLFSDRAEAEAYRDDILSRARLMRAPFSFGPLECLTSLSSPALRARL